ncbi:hypothetical protein R75461_04992 [Paraburkholderia nemoris]|nr:hypothetical protein [Paraburkholderia aspalathi]CAE6796849.1 hypothetical protein R75461_04992 [Paraburkholderia nemoris]
MTEQVCDVAECTFPQTGVCMNSFKPEDCPSHKAALARLRGLDVQPDKYLSDGAGTLATDDQVVSVAGEAVLVAPDEKPSLPRSGTLGLRESDALMSDRYVNLIGIVGLPNAGKTASLASLYLLLAHGSLRGFSYADSRTLMALEEIARGTRRWNDGSAPAEMTVHTELADDRQAGFLHLRLRRDVDGRKFDLLMPDLPGEWSRGLIINGDADKFEFLRAAETVWLMADGRDFLEGQKRELAIHRLTNLIERLTSILPTPRPRTILVPSWRDRGEFPKEALERVQEYGKQFGFAIEFAPIASFSDTAVPPGFGLAELVEMTLSVSESRPVPWPVDQLPYSHRSFLNFGRSP